MDALAARDQFISVVSRELRNSVAPMVLLADHFEQTTRGMADSKLPSRVATLRRQLHKFVATIDQIAEVAKLRDGEIELDIAHVDMAAEVADVAVRMREQAAAGGVDLVVEAGQPTHGWWDRARLRQIASHLVSNAIRYGGVGTVEVTVRHRGPDAELEVRDHGPGIGAAELATLFDRLDHPSPRTSGGFGMGLFVVKAVARAMGGGVSVDHAAGGGARFRVLLPRG
ncbi:MAG: HAMP domain-containing histidine kinase [Deltaproteobacteria bacterium]|nr:HAMP domain-containing histidine kinase [Deltaproteobacteria bacterium]